MNKWKVLSTNKKITTENDVISELMSLRKITDENDFFNAEIYDLDVKKTSISPQEIRKTVKRIDQSILKKETIIILGDYDVDGICASAILWETIYTKYKNVFPYIPDRFSEGYGISVKTIDNILKKYPDTKLIITVDNGIVANESVDYANEKKVDVIITDHHIPNSKKPNSYATIHTTELCGAGVAWFLAKELNFETEGKINEKLELAALATVTDLVPIVNFNRKILKIGLRYLRKTKRTGLVELLKISQIEKEEIGVYEIGHIIGPRLNAAGRVDHAIESLRLLCSNDKKYAQKSAFLLDTTNKTRQKMVASAVEHAKLSILTEEDFGKFIGLNHSNYSEGIIGLIASRLVESYYKPAVIISRKDKISKGSARSIKGVNIVEVLRSTSDILVNVGGHPMAAGFSIETKKITNFYKRLSKEFEKIPDSVFKRELKADMEIPLELVSKSLHEKLLAFSPFGIGNPEPVFMSNNLKVLSLKKLGSDGKHLKLNVGSGKKTIDAIGFNMGDMEISVGDEIEAAFSIDINAWNGKKTLQLKLKDIKS